jgi:hypothetical protein
MNGLRSAVGILVISIIHIIEVKNEKILLLTTAAKKIKDL